MSGTPRMSPIGVLPAGSVFWDAGLPNTWLKPPPAAIQATSAWPAVLWHLAGGGAESILRGWLAPAVGSVHRYVPPTRVTSGSDAGHSTVGSSIVEPPWPTGVFLELAEPPSPDEPRTVTPFAAAALYA